MKVEDLVLKIKSNNYLDSAKKAQWMALVPHMTEGQLQNLAGILTWLDEKITSIENEKTNVLTILNKTFTGMNKFAFKNARAKTLALIEQSERAEEEKVLNQLDND
jgi:hypothetical protein